MKGKFLIATLSIATLFGCATPLDDERRLSEMEKFPAGVYCSVSLPSGDLAFTNSQALHVQYRIGDLPSCDVLYEVYYDYGALTARQKLELLEQQLIKINEEITQSKATLTKLEEME